MVLNHWVRSLLTLSVLVGVLAAAPLAMASPEPSGPHAQAGTAPRHDLIQGAHVEGHIAFLHAELGITQAQETLWAPVAGAMRDDVKNLQEAEGRVARQNGSNTAVQYLENRAMFERLRADGEARFLAAFRPLYENLAPEQRLRADGLLIPNYPN
ncbi:MAG: Spy/CpxP family protein refolding chaperone [Pseudomonadota bacterium]|nr:Spy/CpxP family protein refolding chaperone [Pseudomonadota bacterium]